MKLISFKAEEVHGYLDFNLKLNENLNFLIGNNGSGKTSAIKLILGLLSPSWFNLTQISYKYAEVICQSDNKKIHVRADKHDNDKVKLTLSIDNDEENSKSGIIKVVSTPINQVPTLTRFEKSQLINRYARYEAHFLELDVVEKIRNLITPVFLGLDRRIHVGSEIDQISFEGYTRDRDFTQTVKGSLYDSLVDVENLVKNAYLEYSQKQSQISTKLKNDIIFSLFTVIKNDPSTLQTDYNVDLDSKQSLLIEASKNIDVQGLELNIKKYFKELKRIQKELKSVKGTIHKDLSKKYLDLLSEWFINSTQLHRFDNIIKLYESAQNNLTIAYENFLKFEIIINKFFGDSDKLIQVQKSGILSVGFPNGNTSSIFELSSGEKQVLVMIIQLIFGAKRNIFIIDEPELSLHLGWQQIFVESVLEASPDTQFILATHSPTIIGAIENEKYCIDLEEDINA